jgi:hypothetical protein
MPINKDKEQFVKEQLPYDIISRQVVQSIKRPDALAIWVYLQSMPPDWCVRRTQIREHFGIGRDRYDSAMKELRGLGLVWDTIVRDNKGRISHKSLVVEALLDSQRVHHGDGKPTLWIKQQEGETDHIQNKILLKEKDNKDIRSNQFDDWYAKYPKKQGKKQAKKTFMNLSSQALITCLADDLLTRYKNTDRQFIPLPATYLNGERWDDELDTKPTSKDVFL